MKTLDRSLFDGHSLGHAFFGNSGDLLKSSIAIIKACFGT